MQRWLSETAGNAIRLDRAARPHSGTWAAARSISACAQAFLTYYAIDPDSPEGLEEASRLAGIEVGDVRTEGAHLTMTLTLPMPWNSGRMTIVTHADAAITLPGMTFSPAIAKAAAGRPLSRLIGHPALDRRQQLVVTNVDHVVQQNGINCAILRFRDIAEPIGRPINC